MSLFTNEQEEQEEQKNLSVDFELDATQKFIGFPQLKQSMQYSANSSEGQTTLNSARSTCSIQQKEDALKNGLQKASGHKVSRWNNHVLALINSEGCNNNEYIKRAKEFQSFSFEEKVVALKGLAIHFVGQGAMESQDYEIFASIAEQLTNQISQCKQKEKVSKLMHLGYISALLGAVAAAIQGVYDYANGNDSGIASYWPAWGLGTLSIGASYLCSLPKTDKEANRMILDVHTMLHETIKNKSKRMIPTETMLSSLDVTNQQANCVIF